MAGSFPPSTPETLPYWDAVARHELELPWCEQCEGFFFYPRPHCPECGSTDLRWRPVSGEAKLISFVINYRPFPPLDPSPVIVALVELAEGPRLMTNIVGVDPVPQSLTLDMPLTVAFIERAGGTLPVFTPKEVVQ